MAILTTSVARNRTFLKTFVDSVLLDIETAYAIYEADIATNQDFSYSVRVVAAGFNGSEYFLIAEVSYPEHNTNPAGQVPAGDGE